MNNEWADTTRWVREGTPSDRDPFKTFQPSLKEWNISIRRIHIHGLDNDKNHTHTHIPVAPSEI